MGSEQSLAAGVERLWGDAERAELDELRVQVATLERARVRPADEGAARPAR